MVWRVPRRRNDGSTIICSNPYRNKRTADQVMYKRNALCSELQGTVGEHQIMVYQGRSMRYLDKKIFAYTIVCFFTVCEIIRQTVMMKKISGNACSLCLPVQPDSSGTVVDMVSADDHIDSCVHFDTADLCAGQVLLIINMMNMVILNDGESSGKRKTPRFASVHSWLSLTKLRTFQEP